MHVSGKRGVLYGGMFLSLLMLMVGGAVSLHYLSPTARLPLDTVVFSTAYQVAVAGGNPYDVSLLAPLQAPWYPVGYGPCPFLNPPVLLLLLSPLLEIELPSIALWWRSIGIGASVLAGIILAGGFSWRGWLYGASFALFNVPLISMLHWGQLGGILALAIALIFRALTIRSPTLLGIALTVFAAKPLTFYLFLVLVLIYIAREFSLREAVVTLALPALAFALTAILLPASFAGWISSGLGSQRGSDYSVFNFETDSLGSLLSYAAGFGKPEPVFLALIVAVSLVATVLSALRTKHSFGEIGAIVLPISAITSPYGWVHDRVILAMLPLLFWGKMSHGLRAGVSMISGLIQIAAFNSLATTGAMGSLWWYSWAILVFMLFILYFLQSPRESSKIEISSQP